MYPSGLRRHTIMVMMIGEITNTIISTIINNIPATLPIHGIYGKLLILYLSLENVPTVVTLLFHRHIRPSQNSPLTEGWQIGLRGVIFAHFAPSSFLPQVGEVRKNSPLAEGWQT